MTTTLSKITTWGPNKDNGKREIFGGLHYQTR
jgi:hypothetical protein